MNDCLNINSFSAEERISMLLQEGDRLFEQSGHIEKAIEVYLKAVKLAPDMYRAHEALAEAYRMAGNRHEEMKERIVALAVAQNDEERARALNNLADPLAFFGPVEVAIGCQKEAVSRAPHSGLYWRNLASFQIREKDVLNGLAALERSRSLEGENAPYWYWTGKAKTLLGQYEEAVTAFERCVEYNPIVPYWRALGMSYVKTEQYEEAKQIAKTKLGDGLAAHLILAKIECQLGHFGEAAVLVKHALEVMGGPEKFIEVRRHYCNRRSHEELIDYVREILSGLPEVPWVHWILARLFSVLDDTSAVNDEIREVLRLDPTLTSMVENDEFFQKKH